MVCFGLENIAQHYPGLHSTDAVMKVCVGSHSNTVTPESVFDILLSKPHLLSPVEVAGQQ